MRTILESGPEVSAYQRFYLAEGNDNDIDNDDDDNYIEMTEYNY